MITAMPKQLPLDLSHAPGLSRDDLIVGGANREAVDLIGRWPDWPSPIALLVGPAGSGKTHIASIWQAESGAVALDPARLEGDLMRGQIRPILVDGAGDGHIDEQGLFHLINAIRSAGSFMLMTSRRRPSSWSVRLPDLISRLKAATTIDIAAPDDQLLAAVIMKLFADRQVVVEPQVVSFLTSRMERSLSAASSLVDRLDRAALERKGRITRALAAEILSQSEGTA